MISKPWLSIILGISLCAAGMAAAEDADSLYQKGRSAYNAGEEQKAVALLEQSLAKDKTYLSSYLLLLKIATDKDDKARSLRLLNSMEMNFPKEELVQQFKGDFHFFHGETELAEKAYRRCVDAKTYNYFCYLGLSSILLSKEKADEGLKLLEDSLERFDQKTILLNYLANFCLMLGKHAEALTYLNKALLGEPSYLFTYLNIARTLNSMSHFSEALTFLETAEQGGKAGDRDIQLNKGIALLGLGRYPQAVAAFDLSLRADAQFVWALYHKAVTLVRMKRGKDAKPLLDKAAKSAPYGTEIQRKIRELQATL